MKNTKLWLIDNIQLFDGLPISQKMTLQSILKEKKYSKNEYIYKVDDPTKEVIFVHSGRVKIIKQAESEKESIKRILNPGDYYGENAAMDPQMFTHHLDSAKVMDKDTVVYSMPLEDFKNVCESNAAINAKVVKNMLTNYRRLDNRLASVMLKKSKNRIIDFIKELAEDIGRPVGYEMLIKHNLTHQEIANITGISRQKVTTILNEFKQEGLIHLERNSILVHDTKLLA